MTLDVQRLTPLARRERYLARRLAAAAGGRSSSAIDSAARWLDTARVSIATLVADEPGAGPLHHGDVDPVRAQLDHAQREIEAIEAPRRG